MSASTTYEEAAVRLGVGIGPDVDRVRTLLGEIVTMHQQLQEQDDAIAAPQLSALPRGSSVPALPGGERAAMLGPWALTGERDASVVHPEATLVGWAVTVHGAAPTAPPASLSAAVAFLSAEAPHVLASPWWGGEFVEDVERVHRRLAVVLSRYVPHACAPDDGKESVAVDLREEIERGHPDPDARLSAAQAELVWPGIAQRIKRARMRESVSNPAPPRRPCGGYRLGDLQVFAERKRGRVAA